MFAIGSRYNILFTGFLVSIVVVFAWLRPFDSPWHRFIAGDGLGYYSYLPAQFIYNDDKLGFEWFNKVYKANYTAGTFENPEDNFLVKFGDKKINKYYQGLSFVWMPFFFAAHGLAHALHQPADGYSAPYQLMMGIASLFYLIIGLLFLRKLLEKLFSNKAVSVWVPVFIFYGTYLFNYAVNYNTLSHVYSFTFMVLFVYFAHKFFNDGEGKLKPFLLAVLFFTITVCIRPLNGISLLIVPAFIPQGSLRQKIQWGKIRAIHVIVILTLPALIYYQLRLMHIQTGSFFSYTYSDERFYFGHSKFFDSLFSYNLGLFVYSPLMLLAFGGIPFLKGRQRYIFPLLFLLLSYVYSCWWYWPIVKRALVDYYFIPAIMLAALLSQVKAVRFKMMVFAIMLLFAIYYQFKEMQIRRGILSEFMTYREVYWRNFFRTRKACMFLVPPSSVIDREEYSERFENPAAFTNLSNGQKHSGNNSLAIGPKGASAVIGSRDFPALFMSKARKKVRLSFWSYFEEGMGPVHVFIQLFDKDHKLLKEEPFYLGGEDLAPNRWDYMEFGCEIEDPESLKSQGVDKIEFAIWNTESKKNMWVDDAKFEFMLCDESFETTR